MKVSASIRILRLAGLTSSVDGRLLSGEGGASLPGLRLPGTVGAAALHNCLHEETQQVKHSLQLATTSARGGEVRYLCGQVSAFQHSAPGTSCFHQLTGRGSRHILAKSRWASPPYPVCHHPGAVLSGLCCHMAADRLHVSIGPLGCCSENPLHTPVGRQTVSLGQTSRSQVTW